MTLTDTTAIATFTHEDAYETLLRFVNRLDDITATRRISGKFASTSDVYAINTLACSLWRIFRNKRDALCTSGMSWNDSVNYAAAYVLSLYANAAF